MSRFFLHSGEKQKRLREKAAQNNQISEKTSLLVKKTLKNLYNSKKMSTFARKTCKQQTIMQSIKKSIKLFTDEKYRALPFGTVYFVEGTASAKINDYVLSQIESIEERINQDTSNWVTCKIVYLKAENPFFPAEKKATLYSAMMPVEDIFLATNDSDFFVARLDITATDLIETAVSEYFDTLQEMFDEILDTGQYKEYHFRKTILSPYEDSGIRFSITRSQDDEVMFSITPKPFPFTELSRLVITPLTYTVLLPDYDREIHFTAQVKALYCLFLNHPEGIRMKEISDYKEEYIHLYFCLTNRSDTDKLRESVNRLLDVCNPNALNVKKSQCNLAIRRAIPNHDLRKHYEIEVNYGLPHKINLDRSLVTMPDNLKAK